MTEKSAVKPFLEVLSGRRQQVPPVWMMRQAGRYLPEYRELRAKAGGFLDMCFTPEYAAEVTLQPIRRFNFDAAIIFSDILVIPYALGRSVRFEAGEGPRLDPLDTPDKVATLAAKADFGKLEPVCEALRRVRAELDAKTALIGFCGAPWTVATYMVAGQGTPDQAPARGLAYRHPEAFERIIDTLVENSIPYLVGQLKAGADAVQIFDTWAGTLSADVPGFRDPGLLEQAVALDPNYQPAIEGSSKACEVTLTRPGHVWIAGVQVPVTVEKRLSFNASDAGFDAKYRVINQSREPISVTFGVELNLNLLGGGGNPSAYRRFGEEGPAQRFDSPAQSQGVDRVDAGNSYLGVAATLAVSRPATAWWASIDSVSRQILQPKASDPYRLIRTMNRGPDLGSDCIWVAHPELLPPRGRATAVWSRMP